jgi:hypothetical protein
MYDQAYPHPGIVHTEGETNVDYEPNVESYARNEMGEYKNGNATQ